jgi:hypothetical protein
VSQKDERCAKCTFFFHFLVLLKVPCGKKRKENSLLIISRLLEWLLSPCLFQHLSSLAEEGFELTVEILSFFCSFKKMPLKMTRSISFSTNTPSNIWGFENYNFHFLYRYSVFFSCFSTKFICNNIRSKIFKSLYSPKISTD